MIRKAVRSISSARRFTSPAQRCQRPCAPQRLAKIRTRYCGRYWGSTRTALPPSAKPERSKSFDPKPPATAHRPSRSRQLLIAQSMRLVGFGAQSLAALGLVGLVVPLAPHRLAFAFERKDVGGHAVQEPSIVRYDDRAAAKIEQSFLQRSEGIDVEIVGRLVEEQEVPSATKQLGQVHAIPFAAGQLRHFSLLIGTLEVEASHIAATGNLALAQHKVFRPSGDFFKDGLGAVKGVSVLVDVGRNDGLPHAKAPGVGLLLSNDHPKQRRLAGAIGADDADDPAAGEVKVQVLHQQVVAVSLAHALGPHDQVAQVRTGGDLQGQLVLALRRILGWQGFHIG